MYLSSDWEVLWVRVKSLAYEHFAWTWTAWDAILSTFFYYIYMYTITVYAYGEILIEDTF